jgi:hypothetical protein
MTRPKAIAAGICTGMICCGVIGAAAWHYQIADNSPQILPRKWFVSSPDRLDRKTLSSDVWLCPDSPLIEPVSIQRVEWEDPSLIGRDTWGYFVFYRARVADTRLSQHLRGVAVGELETLPSWATHLPSWWNPQRSVPIDRLTQLDLQSDNVFIYWIRAPFEGRT